MTKIILHGRDAAAPATLEVTPSVSQSGSFYLHLEDSLGSADFKVPKETLIQFAHTILDEYEDDAEDEDQVSYVEVIEG